MEITGDCGIKTPNFEKTSTLHLKRLKMMAATDPGAGTAAVTVGAEMTDAGDSDKKQIWRFIYADMAFVKSNYGIIVVIEILLSLLGLISVSVPKNEGCAYLYGSAYSYYEFTCTSCFIVSLIWYLLYVLSITSKLGFVRWDIAEIAWCGFYIFNYLIASSVIAAKSCYQGGYQAAAVFGFLCLIALGVHMFLVGRSFLEKRQSNVSRPAQNASDDENKY